MLDAPLWLRIYLEILGQNCERNQETPVSNTALLCRCLLPLLQMDAFVLGLRCLQLDDLFLKLNTAILSGKDRDNASNELNLQRLWLRRFIADSEDTLSCFRTYLSSLDPDDWTQDPAYVSIKEEIRHIQYDARRLECEVRDHMQLEMGKSSLQESRNSIELSNLQIVEGKRG